MSEYQSVNPATGQTLQIFENHTSAEITASIAAADKTYRDWRSLPLESRASVLTKVAHIYRDRTDEIATSISVEMGKPITQARYELKLVAEIYEYYAENAREFLADEELNVRGEGRTFVRKQPVGVLLGIMPWNYPCYQVARFAAPNLMLGNTILLKHSPTCPRTALLIEEIFDQAGLLRGAYMNIFATNQQVEGVIADARVQGVSLTGSERAGSAVAEIAGRHLKKVVLELGGSDAFVVLDSKDLENVVEIAVGARMINTGQACNSAKRFIVMDSVYDDFVSRFTERMRSLTPGDPLDQATVVGPLSSRSAADHFLGQITDAISKGAEVHTGGGLLEGAGAFVEPTVLTAVTPAMRVFSEEIFGPAAVIYRVRSAAEAVELANNSPFGLGGAVFSEHEELAISVANSLDTGMVWVNGSQVTQADLPFGGIKRSGFGHELGRQGMEEFMNRKLMRIVQVG